MNLKFWSIGLAVAVFKPGGIHGGHLTTIGTGSFVDGRMGLYIGNNVNIAAEARKYTMEHDIADADFAAIGEPTPICDWTYLRARLQPDSLKFIYIVS